MSLLVGSKNWSNEYYAALFQRGDEKALGYYYREYKPALTHYAYQWVRNRIIAEEIASEAFIKTWRMHWKLNSMQAIRSYLYKTVKNACLDRIEQEQKRTILQHNFKAPTGNDTPFDYLVRSETYRIIHSAIRKLTPANRKVIIMHYLEGKTTGQIAKELNLHPSTIKTQKKNGLQALRKAILLSSLLFQFLFLKF